MKTLFKDFGSRSWWGGGGKSDGRVLLGLFPPPLAPTVGTKFWILPVAKINRRTANIQPDVSCMLYKDPQAKT